MEEIKRVVEFEDGTPTQVTASVSCKLSTLPYESIDFFSSITVALKEGADVSRAYESAFNFLEKEVLGPKVKATRAKFGKK